VLLRTGRKQFPFAIRTVVEIERVLAGKLLVNYDFAMRALEVIGFGV
jgi:hypothetical protein